MEDGSRKRKSTIFTLRRACTTVMIGGGLLSLLYSNISWKALHHTSAPSLETSAAIHIAKNGSLSLIEPRRILLWTPAFGLWPPQLENLERGDVVMQNCASLCHITRDRSLLESSDAIVFHARDTNITDMPEMRTPSQVWVLRNHEPPESSGFERFLDAQIFFNWTMTYRSDSDVHLPYGRLVKANLSTGRDYDRLWTTKSKMAVWMVSNCWTPGNREEFAEELDRYIKVDVLGFCGSDSCPPEDGYACYERFEREYFFMLAFENSLCRDYVTEKFFIALMYDIVPVVFGGANYSRFAPPGSYIDALDFETPVELAEHLLFVAGNASVYKSYFRWKTLFRVERMDSENFWPPCALCSKLHSQTFETKGYYENLSKWWKTESHCWRWTSSENNLSSKV